MSEETAAAKLVLIVDDEERNRRLLDVLVRTEGYQTISASNGHEAIALAKSAQPDLILLDLMMPAMDGFDVTSALKNDPATSAIPIIIVSALNDMAVRRRLLASGVDEFINKPVDRWELSLRLSRLLSRRYPADGSADHA